MISTGRNNLLENLWRALTGWMRSTPQGSQRPRALTEQRASRELNLEIPEFPIRHRVFASELISMVHNQPEVAQAIRISAREIYSSEDGDDQGGVKVSKWLDAEETRPLRSDLHAAASDCLRRVFDVDTLYTIAWRKISYGDCFGNIVIADRRNLGVHRLLLLPTWEMFRIETDSGELLGFEQRRMLDDQKPIRFHPGLIVHWRHNRQGLYGRSQFAECLPDWREYQRAVVELGSARHEIGVNPIVYQFDPSYGEDAIQSFQLANEEGYRSSQGTISRIYLPSTVQASRLNTRDPDLKAIVDDLQERKLSFVRASELPLWQFAGFDTTGAADIAGQPALAHSRLVNHRRQTIGQGIRQVLLTDLVLRFGLGVLEDAKDLRLEWPEFHVRTVDTEAAVAAQAERADAGAEQPDNPDTLAPAREQLEGLWQKR